MTSAGGEVTIIVRRMFHNLWCARDPCPPSLMLSLLPAQHCQPPAEGQALSISACKSARPVQKLQGLLRILIRQHFRAASSTALARPGALRRATPRKNLIGILERRLDRVVPRQVRSPPCSPRASSSPNARPLKVNGAQRSINRQLQLRSRRHRIEGILNQLTPRATPSICAELDVADFPSSTSIKQNYRQIRAASPGSVDVPFFAVADEPHSDRSILFALIGPPPLPI